ncbi:hypothetical protein SSP531S_58610 [Streptomyces spongiicola]|uniref:Uncharacterized protein n=1 Tax=Streptomyces spongiicola TaxID=1690221 RepID=A0A388T625_9ACTN|nr:hypothetical protein [Streptomyces spongiicola]GBQ04367.1 hypothetical protein SSP531S_58610 [Streptomyces spongiicola]
MRMPRLLARRPRPTSLLAAGLAAALLGAAAALGPTVGSGVPSTAPSPRPASTVAADTADLAAAYSGGWQAGVADLGDGTKRTHPNVVADGSHPGTVAWADGWADGQADALGDDNRDGVVDEDESGWDCRTMGNRLCGEGAPAERKGAGEVLELCVTVASRPAYSWTNPDGSRAENPDGRVMLRDLEAAPGAPAFAAALRALDAEYRARAGRR